MANQFIIKNGLIVDQGGAVVTGSSTLSGSLSILGNTTITGSLNVAYGITGSLFGTSSWAQNSLTASYFITSSVTSASYSITSSTPLKGIVTASVDGTIITFNKGDGTSFSLTIAQSGSVASASYVSSSGVYGPYGYNSIVSSSYALTASYISGGLAPSASYILSSNVYGPNGFDSISYALTASYALNAVSTAIPGNSTASFVSSSTWNFNHNLSASLVVIQTFDSLYNQIIPQNIALVDTLNAVITFPQPISGYAIASLGGSTSTNNTLSSSYAITASYALNAGSGGTGTGLPNRFILSGSEFIIQEGLQSIIYDMYNYGTLTLQSGSVSLPLGNTYITNNPLLTIETVLYNSGVINNGGIIQYLT